ncbi:two-component regulator propeller domain-containing protein [Sorangium sp. So ce385]|uniref:two-component regulator propeller domain-containing protein n=1 Tax=Sorangium sp. So ce385 TaxID=3133308 RepID=UPI003F5C3670
MESPKLEPWDPSLAEEPELLSSRITAVYRDSNGVLWFGTMDKGVSRFSPKTGSWSTYTTKDGLANDSVLDIARSGDGSVWFGTAGGGVSRFNPNNRSWSTYTVIDGLAGNFVHKIAHAADDSLWFGTFGGGVSRFDPKTGAWTTYTTKDGLAHDDVRAIAQAADGSLWFGTFGGGVSRFDPKTGAWVPYTTKNGLAHNSVQSITQVVDGSLWFGTFGGGVSRFDPKTGAWATYTTKNGLAHDDVQSIAQVADGSLWFGTLDGGVSRFDPKTGAWATYTTKNGLAHDDVRAIAQAADGSLWFGTFAGGVSRFDPKAGSWATYTAKDGPTHHAVLKIAQAADGSLWFVTINGSLSRFDPKSGSWATYATKDGFAFNDVRAIVQDADGLLWFGTSDGVSRLDPKTGAWGTYTTKDGLAHDDVRAIAQDADGSLWFGTSNGVSRFDPKTRSWITYTTKDGLAHDGVRAIAQDSDGSLWFGTSNGVSRFDPKAGAWITYTTKDGLAPDGVQAIARDADGLLWFGTSDGVSRFDPKTRSWTTYNIDGSLSANIQGRSQFLHMATAPAGSLWFSSVQMSASGSVRMFGGSSPIGSFWSSYLIMKGYIYNNSILPFAQDTDEFVYQSTVVRGRISRFDTKTRSWATYFTKSGLGVALTIAGDASGSLWVGSARGTTRFVAGRSNEAGTAQAITRSRARIVVAGDLAAVAGPNGLSFVSSDWKAHSIGTRSSFSPGANITALAPCSSGVVWAGTDLGGLTLRVPTLRVPERPLQITPDQKLPSWTVTAISVVPDTGCARAWVGTTAGPALVRREQETLHADPVHWEGMPTGPVDALVAGEDGSVYLAYNALPSDQFLDPDLAKRRSRTRVYHVSAPDRPRAREIVAVDALAASQVRALAYSPKHGLWAGTSAGLFVVKASEKGSAGAGAERFEPVTGQGRLPPMPISRLVIAPDDAKTLWMGVDRQGDTPALVVGYRPGTGWVYTLTPDLGVPRGNTIDDLAFTPDGDLIVLVGSTLARGPVFVPIAPDPTWLIWLAASVIGVLVVAATVAVAQRRNLYLRTPLAGLALAGLPSTIASMRRFRVLDESWSRLGLPTTRVRSIEALASPAAPPSKQLRALADLLGMEHAAAAPVKARPHGVSYLAARLPYPAPLRGHPVAFVSLDLAQARSAEPAHLRAALEAALKEANQRFELPFVLLARDDVQRDVLPADLGSLRLGERELKALLFARDPQRTFAGLLHARRLVALSPYTTSGEVKDEQMFFGRVALLKELLIASSIQHIVIGPRRVGKTSLLKRLLRELPARRPDVDAAFVDLLGVADPTRAARTLARTLKRDVPRDHEPETALADLLRAHFQDSGKRGLVLIDEADGLIQADAARGYPLLSALRTLQAEEVCSFILAGYLFLYRESLNHRSPLYNFATVRTLGPLEREAARDLALVPMQRLGVAYADPELPSRIAERTGGYPSFVQELCDAELDVLREVGSGDLVLSAEHLAQAEQKVGVSLRDVFRSNAGDEAQLLVYQLLDRDDFSAADAQQALASALGRAVPTAVVDRALQELRLFGFLVEQHGRFSFAIPLLRDTLRAGDQGHAAEQLMATLSSSS